MQDLTSPASQVLASTIQHGQWTHTTLDDDDDDDDDDV